MPVLFSALVTGAGGFVGRALARALPAPPAVLALGTAGWQERLREAPFEGRTVFHLAARVHDPGDRDEAAFHRDNVVKTTALAEEAARRGARRLVFVSTSKVYGEESTGRPFDSTDPPAPWDAYARSKTEAEQVIRRVAARSGFDFVIVRAPLVLGAGARGNVRAAMRLADGPWPLPFAAIRNRRSFVHVDDLARLLVGCASYPGHLAAVFDAAHPEPMSTPALFTSLRHHLGRAARLFGVDPGLLERVAALAGAGDRMRRLTRSLEIDPAAAMRIVGWHASIGLDEAAAGLARAWRSGWS